MYWITVNVNYMVGTISYRRFDTWDDAGGWVSNLANDDKMPKEIIMGIVWR